MSNTDQNPIPAPQALDGDAPKKKTINDPVAPEILQRLATLTDARGQVALRLLDLEQEKIQCLGAAKRLADENERLFTAILVERGLAPGTVVNIDGRTGRIKLADEKEAESLTNPEAAEPAPEPQAE